MIRLLLEPVNLLILDEPTNHLDMTRKDILKQAKKDFDGTVIVVSHDREFLDGLVERCMNSAEVRCGNVWEVYMSFTGEEETGVASGTGT